MATAAGGKSQREVLESMTTVVADTGELDAIIKYKPQDATTNPSLVLKALDKLRGTLEYDEILSLACKYAREHGGKDPLATAVDRIAVEFGVRIMRVIPGNVSTELDARLSFDVEESIVRAERIVRMYEELGVENAKDRLLIKVAATWEGFQVCKALNERGIRCNVTLIFNIWQAAAAAQIGGAFLISPFVGRITDWHKKERGVDTIAIDEDPGPQSVSEIYKYFKSHGFKTIVMGASFRSKAQILALAGCDYLTIGPQFLEELATSDEAMERKLDAASVTETVALLDVAEPRYRYAMATDPMATEKLAAGIRGFAADTEKLEKILQAKLDELSSSAADK
jgi:transaldolase